MRHGSLGCHFVPAMLAPLFPVKVLCVRQEAIDVKSFDLVSATGGALPAFAPGAHIDVRIAEHLVRQYSLRNGPRDTGCYRIAVKLEAQSRGGSKFMHSGVQEGDLLQIGAPRNNFPLREEAPFSVLLAGGIGITPLVSMALHLIESGRQFLLHYFTRSRAHAAYYNLLSGPQFKSNVMHLHGLDPEGVRAHLDKLLSVRRDDAHLYYCGPRPFMDSVSAAAVRAWPSEAVHLEYFSADPAPQSRDDDAFLVRLARSGEEYTIPADQSIVEALAEHGITIVTRCEQGACGECVTRVLEGTPDHRDFVLTDEEKAAGDRLACCVSRSKSPVLVLDL